MKYPLSITIIAADHPIVCFPSWPFICDVIKKLLPSDDNWYRSIITALEVKVRNIKQNDDKLLVLLCNSLEVQGDSDFESLLLCDKFLGTFYCETVLATMALYPDLAIQNNNEMLKRIAKALFLPESFFKSDPMLTVFETWGYQGVKAMLSSLRQAFPLFTGGI